MSKKGNASGGLEHSGEFGRFSHLEHLVSERPRSIRENKEALSAQSAVRDILYITESPLDTLRLYEEAQRLTKSHKKSAGEMFLHEGTERRITSVNVDNYGTIELETEPEQHYNISCVTSPETGKIFLSIVHVVRNRQKIEEVLRRLHSMKVANIEEKFWVEYRLNQVLNELIGA